MCLFGPLSTSYGNRTAHFTSPPPWHFLNPSFPSLHPLVFPSPASSAFDSFFPHTHRHPRMPPKTGPWALEGVKRRLRQEQVARERAASERYRQREEREQREEWDNLRAITPVEERSVGGIGAWNCYLCVLVFICVILLLCVVVLCGTVYTLLKKDNER